MVLLEFVYSGGFCQSTCSVSVMDIQSESVEFLSFFQYFRCVIVCVIVAGRLFIEPLLIKDTL